MSVFKVCATSTLSPPLPSPCTMPEGRVGTGETVFIFPSNGTAASRPCGRAAQRLQAQAERSARS
jgi:hypothetical protein